MAMSVQISFNVHRVGSLARVSSFLTAYQHIE